MGLGREKKLRKTDEFSSVFRFRQVKRGQCVDLHVMPNAHEHARIGLVVPRKVARLAVRRNRYKRLMREIFRLHLPELAAVDLVARVKDACADEQFKDEFTRLLLTQTRAGRAPDPAPPAAPAGKPS